MYFDLQPNNSDLSRPEIVKKNRSVCFITQSCAFNCRHGLTPQNFPLKDKHLPIWQLPHTPPPAKATFTLVGLSFCVWGFRYIGSSFTPYFGVYSFVVVAGVDRVQVTVGDNLKVTFSFVRQDNTDNSITYLVRLNIPAHHTQQLSQVAKQGKQKNLQKWFMKLRWTSFLGTNIAGKSIKISFFLPI